MSESGSGTGHSLTVGGRKVALLNDTELEAEATLRRNARVRAPQLLSSRSTPVTPEAAAAGPATPIVPAGAAASPPVGRLLVRRELEQYLANLELQPGATLDTVREQYFRLRERYDPKKQASEEKRQVAAALVERLMRAYEALSAHYEAKGDV